MRRYLSTVRFSAPRPTVWKRKAAAAILRGSATPAQFRPAGADQGSTLVARAYFARRLARRARSGGSL
jgi:hypothetical protein